jgi:hypothetical protein
LIKRKIVGYFFLLIAGFLTLAIIGLLPTLLRTIFGFFIIFTGNLDASQVGFVTGSLIYWILHFMATISLWKHGMRRIKKPQSNY